MAAKEDHLCRGRLYAAKGEHKEAIAEYREALRIDPHYKPARVNLSLASYMRGEVNEDMCLSNRHMKQPKHGGRRRKSGGAKHGGENNGNS